MMLLTHPKRRKKPQPMPPQKRRPPAKTLKVPPVYKKLSDS